MTNLVDVWLYSNYQNGGLRGEIPPEIGNLTNLASFQIHNCKFTGEIPSEIGQLGQQNTLNYLKLQGNQFSGQIPESICDIPIDWSGTWGAPAMLQHNNLCPPYPSCIPDSQIQTQDTSECFQNHALSDIEFLQSLINIIAPYELDYPEPNYWEIGNQQWEEIDGVLRLVYFECEGNMGGIPTCSGAPGGFSGSFPQNIVNVTYLRELHLSNNNLTGIIPEGICNLSELSGPNGRFNVGNNNLCPPYPNCGDITTGPLEQYCNPAMGDVNLDSYINSQDIIILVNMILAQNTDGTMVYTGEQIAQQYPHADMNGDGSVDVMDIQLIVQLILNNPRTSESDRRLLRRQLNRLRG